MFKIISTEAYLQWFQEQSLKIQAQISARLERIIEHGHFGEARHLSKRLSELKWKSGLRLYFAITMDDEGKVVILLLGGFKNTQIKDIRKAKKLLSSLLKEHK